MLVGVNEKNQPIGDSHPLAKWTNSEVSLVRGLHADGMGYKRISQVMQMPRSTVRAICLCRVRACYPYRWREANG